MGAHTIAGVVPSTLAAGSYRVHWIAAGRDGHPERGSFAFTVVGSSTIGSPVNAAGDSAGGPTPGDSVNAHIADTLSAPDALAVGLPMTIARWLGFLALFSVVGAVAFRFAILQRLAHRFEADDPFTHVASVGAATYGLFASVALIVATVVKLYGESLAMRDIPPEAIVFATGWGWAWLAQLLACLTAIVGFVIAHRGARSGWSLAALAAVVLVVTPAATGHAIGSDEAVFAVPLDVVHVLAGSIWLGTLAVILIVGIGAAAKTPGTVPLGARVATMINTFSPLALICGGAMVATGVAASLLHIEPLSALWTSWYGRVLIVKLAFVALLFAVGAWNWRRVRPSLGGDQGVRALRFSARIELTVAAMVLMVTAFLIALPLPE
jgi:copper transport protein